jgi:aryl-alcohol dehydrogenase-like predicted oxidoreductase
MSALSRRKFIQSGLAAGAAVSAAGLPLRAEFDTPADPALPKKPDTAASLTPLGNTSLRVSRLAFGKPPNSVGTQEEFTALVRHAYDRGIRSFDTSEHYHPANAYLTNALHGLPRESYTLISKIQVDSPEEPKKHLETVRKAMRQEYFDAILLHFMHYPNWDTETEAWQEALLHEQEKKTIRHHGVSVHGLPALRQIPGSQWVEIAMVRINHTGRSMDCEDWEIEDQGIVPEVVKQVHKIRSQGIGLIGMKLIGAGAFNEREQRAAAVKFAFQQGHVDCVTIGFKNTAEIDEAIENVNAALA